MGNDEYKWLYDPLMWAMNKINEDGEDPGLTDSGFFCKYSRTASRMTRIALELRAAVLWPLAIAGLVCIVPISLFLFVHKIYKENSS